MKSLLIEEIRNAKALNAEETIFDVEINHPEHGWIMYTLDPSDIDMTINNDDLRALIGSNYDKYVEPTEDEKYERASDSIKGMRIYILETLVDPIISNTIRFNSMPESDQLAVTTFRQEWLDITDHEKFPFLEQSDLPVVPSVLSF